MSHMVIYRGSDGKPGYHQVDDIHDAVSFVEEMRNNDGVDHARIFRLEEVTFEYKPYYRVDIGSGAAAVAGASSVATDDDSNSSDDGEQGSVVEIESGDDSDAEESSNGQVDEEASDDSDDNASTEEESDEDTGTGARRGLFGR